MSVSGNIITDSRYDGVGFSTSTGTIDSLGRNGIVISQTFYPAPSGFRRGAGRELRHRQPWPGLQREFGQHGVDLEPTSDTGGDDDPGWTGSVQWYRYTVNVASTGTYVVSQRWPTRRTSAIPLAPT